MTLSNIVCPRCGTVDMARQVPAVVWEGRSAVALHGTYAGAVGWAPAMGVSSHFGTVSTDLAEALLPPPPPPTRFAWFTWIMLLVTLALCLAGVFAMSSNAETTPPASPSPWTLFTVLVTPIAGLIILLCVMLARRLRMDRGWRRAMPDMAAVWNAAWYCGRCAIAYFPTGAIPSQVLPGDQIDPGRFRGVVWQAGIVLSQLRLGQRSSRGTSQDDAQKHDATGCPVQLRDT